MFPTDAWDWLSEKIMCDLLKAHRPLRLITFKAPHYDHICSRCGKRGHLDIQGRLF